MRRLASLFVILCLAFTFTACPGGGGGKKKDEKKNGGDSGGGGGGEQSGGGGGASPAGSLADDLAHIRDDARRVEADPDLLKGGFAPGDLAKGASGPGPLVTIAGVTPADVLKLTPRGVRLLTLATSTSSGHEYRFAEIQRDYPGFIENGRLTAEAEQFISQIEQIPLAEGPVGDGRRKNAREFGPGLRALLERVARDAPPRPSASPPPIVTPPPPTPPPTH